MYDKIPEDIIVKTNKQTNKQKKNFLNIGKEIATQDQEAQRLPHRINLRRYTPKHKAIKLTKIKHTQNNIKSSKGKTIRNIQGKSHKVSS